MANKKLLNYVGFWAWLLKIGTQGWDNSNIANGVGINLNRSGLRLDLSVTFLMDLINWSCSFKN